MSSSKYLSPKFQFLAKVDSLLVELGARTERYALEDPNTSMMKVRQLGELLANILAAKRDIHRFTQGLAQPSRKPPKRKKKATAKKKR